MFLNVSIRQIIKLGTLNIYNFHCQLYLSKAPGRTLLPSPSCWCCHRPWRSMACRHVTLISASIVAWPPSVCVFPLPSLPCESVSSYKDARRTGLGPPYCSQHDVTLMTSEGQSQIWGYEFDVSFGGQFSPPQALSRTSINQAGDCGSHHKGQRKKTQLRQPECPARRCLRHRAQEPG